MSNFAVCSQRQILENWSLGSAAPCCTSCSSASSSLPFLFNKSRKVYNKVSSSSLGREENRHRASRLGLENWKLKSRVFGAREYGGGERGRSWNGKGRWWLQVRAEVEPLDLTEDNVQHVLLDARSELLQIFDTSVGITGVAELVELDGPFVKLRLTGRFWHERSMVLARVANYLRKRIPEVLEVEIEDESQLDDSAANF
ncbi:hypothetical protein CY35_07G118600 [Sphagnum magellanicum]|uniref:Uncharacterized protein n=1 Tax=Sphagnum magellanicum TaxID=128215 RepID=A0ACB8HPE3_9BRYO|nr:hypothetical protein CY35_07G118600 [Sphagnum magellanicum]